MAEFTKILGGGESWYYLIDNDGKILDCAHEDNQKDMKELYDRYKRLQGEKVPERD